MGAGVLGARAGQGVRWGNKRLLLETWLQSFWPEGRTLTQREDSAPEQGEGHQLPARFKLGQNVPSSSPSSEATPPAWDGWTPTKGPTGFVHPNLGQSGHGYSETLRSEVHGGVRGHLDSRGRRSMPSTGRWSAG